MGEIQIDLKDWIMPEQVYDEHLVHYFIISNFDLKNTTTGIALGVTRILRIWSSHNFFFKYRACHKWSSVNTMEVNLLI